MHLPLTSIQPAQRLFQGREGDSAGERSFHSQFHSSLLAQNSRPTIRVWRPESETHSSAIFLQNCLPPLFVFKWPYETFPWGVNLRTSFLLKVPLLLLEVNRLTVIVGDEWLSWNNYDTLKEAQLKSCVLFPCAEQFWELYKQKMCRLEKDTHTKLVTQHLEANSQQQVANSMSALMNCDSLLYYFTLQRSDITLVRTDCVSSLHLNLSFK